MLPVFPSVERLASPAKQRRRLVTERRMQPTPVVKHLDILEGRRHCFARHKAPPMHSLVLEAVEPALGRRIVPAVTLAAHRASHAVVSEFVLKRRAGVLAAPVGVVQHPRHRLAAEPRHRQRIRHDVRCQARFQRPADHFAVEQIKHNRPGTASLRPSPGR